VRAIPKWRSEAEQAYELRHFVIDSAREQVTCPLGKTPVTWRPGLDNVGASRIRTLFSRTDCAARALWTRAKEDVAPSTSIHRPSTRR
jgi:transposase